MKKGQTFNYDFNFSISGTCESHGTFNEPGEGSIKGLPEELNDGKLQIEIIKDASDTFREITQKAKNYTNISELTVSVSDIRRTK